MKEQTHEDGYLQMVSAIVDYILSRSTNPDVSRELLIEDIGKILNEYARQSIVMAWPKEIDRRIALSEGVNVHEIPAWMFHDIELFEQGVNFFSTALLQNLKRQKININKRSLSREKE